MSIKIIATALIGLLGGVFIWFMSRDTFEYYQHVHEVLANPVKWEGKSMQVHGFVVAGSIKEEIVDQKSIQTFEIESCGKSIRVTHAGSKPDTFKALAETVIKGKIVKQSDGSYLVEAVEGESGISAKCPSKYDNGKVSIKCPGDPATAAK